MYSTDIASIQRFNLVEACAKYLCSSWVHVSIARPALNEALELQTVGDGSGRFLYKYICQDDQQTKKTRVILLVHVSSSPWDGWDHCLYRTCTDMSRWMKETTCPGLLRKAATLIALHWVFLRACDTALGAP